MKRPLSRFDFPQEYLNLSVIDGVKSTPFNLTKPIYLGVWLNSVGRCFLKPFILSFFIVPVFSLENSPNELSLYGVPSPDNRVEVHILLIRGLSDLGNGLHRIYNLVFQS